MSYWATMLYTMVFKKKMRWASAKLSVDTHLAFPEDAFKLLLVYSGLGVPGPGRVKADVQQLFIPVGKFAAARLDLFLHGGWQVSSKRQLVAEG
ncbi:hypothetical protein WJX74_000833 [Apatococcus lobatus]|uniref:Uncharacterized protein n=1 Tax=Apatococcus lobatus TaxID=904363 RepID=A0AAW1S8X0_9CHLO